MRLLNVAKAMSYRCAYPHLPIVRKFCDYVIRVESSRGKIYTHDYLKHIGEYEREQFKQVLDHKVPDFAPTMGTRVLVE